MKLPFKYIAILVVLSLVGIFAYQAYWLTGLYHTMHDEMNRHITEAMRMSDYNEMMIRVEKLRNDSISEGEVSVSAGYDGDKPYISSSTNITTPSLENDHSKKGSITVKVEKDTIPDYETTDSSQSAMRVNESLDVILGKQNNMQNLTNYFQRGLHSGLDVISEPDLAVYDSLLAGMLREQGLDVPYRLEHLHKGGGKNSIKAFVDTLAREGTEGYTPSSKAIQYIYAFNLHSTKYYQLTMEPVDMLVLRQMSGILTTSFIILLILSFSFWFLIRTILKQKTLEEMKSDFTNNITHELKTPIAVAYAANDALLNFNQAEEKAQRDKYLRICQEQLQRLSGLVEQILSMSMERRRTFRLRPEELIVQEILEPLIEQHKLKAEKPVHILTDIEPEDLTVMADRTHFSNIISNLIDNAIKYSHGEAEIDIRCRQIATEEQDMQTEISVSDNGIGIAAEKQKHIFDKFYRVPTGNLHDVKGYGLGLFYVKTMTEKHGGSVSVKSELGKGSVFTIKI